MYQFMAWEMKMRCSLVASEVRPSCSKNPGSIQEARQDQCTWQRMAAFQSEPPAFYAPNINPEKWEMKMHCTAPWLHLRSGQVAQRTQEARQDQCTWQRMAAFQSEPPAFYAPNINPELHSLPLSFVVFLLLFPSIYFFRWHEARRLWHFSGSIIWILEI